MREGINVNRRSFWVFRLCFGCFYLGYLCLGKSGSEVKRLAGY